MLRMVPGQLGTCRACSVSVTNDQRYASVPGFELPIPKGTTFWASRVYQLRHLVMFRSGACRNDMQMLHSASKSTMLCDVKHNTTEQRSAMTKQVILEAPLTNRYSRIVGVVLIVVGLFFVKLQIYDPLHAAEDQREKVWIFWPMVACGVYFPLFGALLLLFGKRVSQWFVFDPQNLSLKNVIMLLLIGAIGLAILIYVIVSLENQGYRKLI
jgi:hypothetical protein